MFSLTRRVAVRTSILPTRVSQDTAGQSCAQERFLPAPLSASPTVPPIARPQGNCLPNLAIQSARHSLGSAAARYTGPLCPVPSLVRTGSSPKRRLSEPWTAGLSQRKKAGGRRNVRWPARPERSPWEQLHIRGASLRPPPLSLGTGATHKPR